MGKPRLPVHQKTEHDHKITRNTDGLFLAHLQNSLLLALREQGIISIAQYRQAESMLRSKSNENLGPYRRTGE